MPNETSKARARRAAEGCYDSIFRGHGIDIGCGDDPVTPDCLAWDMPQGDAQELPGIPPYSFDWVYSSHCLEHMRDPIRAISRWWEVLKPNGFLFVVVPDEDLYEQGFWPSRFNADHKWTFTIHKFVSWSPVSVNVADLVAGLPKHMVLWMRQIDAGYEHSTEVWDRTAGNAEAHIEVLLRKIG